MKREKGAVLLELALTLPIFLLLILGGYDLLAASQAKGVCQFVGEQTGACLLHNTTVCHDTTSTAVFAQGVARGMGLPGTYPFNFATYTLPITTSATVTVNYTTVPISPYFPKLTFKIVVTSEK